MPLATGNRNPGLDLLGIGLEALAHRPFVAGDHSWDCCVSGPELDTKLQLRPSGRPDSVNAELSETGRGQKSSGPSDSKPYQEGGLTLT